MPHISIEGPKINDLDKQRKLALAVTEAAAEAFNLPKEVIVVVIEAHSPENVAVGGTLIVDRRK
jgi:4-oxalocrotonate tautomerase